MHTRYFARTASAAALAAIAGLSTGLHAAPFPSSVDLSTLNGATGFVAEGVAQGDYSGLSVASAGDVNGDGVDDMLVGAFAAGPGGVTGAGSTYVVFGKRTSVGGPFPASLDLASLDGANGFRLDGAGSYDYSGVSVARAGDLNGDGVGDIVIGAYRASPGGNIRAGSTFVVFGKRTSVSGPFPAVLPLSTLNGANGFRLDGPEVMAESGTCVARAGDVNGDGVGDLLIGANRASPGGRSAAGSSFVVFGKRTSVVGPFPAVFALSSLTGANGFRVDGVASFDYSGTSVAPAGDINGDGVNDFAVGAPVAGPIGRTEAGATYVVFGKNVLLSGQFPATFALSSLTGANGLRLDGAAPGEASGVSVAPAGDLNADGVGDLVIGAPLADPGARESAGVSYVVFGKNTLVSGAFPASIDLATLSGVNGFRLDGVAAGDDSGFSVAPAGDVNADGVADLVIGAPDSSAAGRAGAGAAYVLFGKRTSVVGAFPATLGLSTLTGVTGFRLDGAAEGDHAGLCVASSGDVTGDGLSDLIIGAYRADSDAGASYVVFGRDAGTAPLCPGDVDGDSHVNFTDLNFVLTDFGRTSPGLAGDLNVDGAVNFLDLNLVLTFFGASC